MNYNEEWIIYILLSRLMKWIGLNQIDKSEEWSELDKIDWIINSRGWMRWWIRGIRWIRIRIW